MVRLNEELRELEDQMDAVKKMNDSFSHMVRTRQNSYWWQAPIDELSVEQLEHLKLAYEELEKRVQIQAQKQLPRNTNLFPNFNTQVPSVPYNAFSSYESQGPPPPPPNFAFSGCESQPPLPPPNLYYPTMHSGVNFAGPYLLNDIISVNNGATFAASQGSSGSGAANLALPFDDRNAQGPSGSGAANLVFPFDDPTAQGPSGYGDPNAPGRAIVLAEFDPNVSASPAMVAASKGGESQMVASLAEHHSPQPQPLTSQTLAENQIDDAGTDLRSYPAVATAVKQKTIVSTSSGGSESSPEAHQHFAEKQASEEVAAAGNSPSVIRRFADLSSSEVASTTEAIRHTSLISLPQNPAISDWNRSCRSLVTSASSAQPTPFDPACLTLNEDKSQSAPKTYPEATGFSFSPRPQVPPLQVLLPLSDSNIGKNQHQFLPKDDTEAGKNSGPNNPSYLIDEIHSEGGINHDSNGSDDDDFDIEYAM
ncbi:OLC1v1037047C1 [Oldenlandia corymbosa var. corymbosa]|uniref:OLC1v1037047C1 n=1 Tax=Oldenlandia corymbosa var. corymbosa TaxID=529605 RepID=A0AAV1CXF3_OLDCO|nr:OLC1v1037047C1 [Oldenlandia corymbosa var. corymbosa]